MVIFISSLYYMNSHLECQLRHTSMLHSNLQLLTPRFIQSENMTTINYCSISYVQFDRKKKHFNAQNKKN